MISFQGKRERFDRLAAYLVGRAPGTDPERVAWTAGRNLPTDDPELAATFMEASALRNRRVQKPAYHMVLSFDRSDDVDRAIMERIADRTLTRMGLGGHQAVLAAHRDRTHPHVHIMVNLVHPETGRTWSAWHDWSRARQVMRDEEHALGLGRAHRRFTKVEELARDLRTYQRVADLAGEQYRALLEESAARSRAIQLGLAPKRARTNVAKCDRALAAVYRDPAQAYRAYLAAADRQGVREATRVMRERPEEFGALVTVERPRLLGLLRTPDEGPARAAAPFAAGAARDASEAVRAWRQATETEARRVEQAFEHELGAIYQEPAAARTAFERLAAEASAERAASVLRERPVALGPLLAPSGQDANRFQEQVTQLAVRGVEAVEARAAANAAPAAERDPRFDLGPLLSRGEGDRAAAQERAARTALRGLPGRGELERRIELALGRLLPHQLRQLKTALTAPQLAIAMQLGRALRDVALGRDDERDAAR